MSSVQSKLSRDAVKILAVWAVTAVAAGAGVLALHLYSIQLIDRIHKTHRNPGIVGLSFQREGERYYARALERAQALHDAGQPATLPANDPDVVRALDLLERAYALQPYQSKILFTLSDLHGLTGNEAEQLYCQGRYYLARESPQRNPQAAFELFERAAALAPGRANYQRGVAESLLELNRLDEALARAEALAAQPDPAPETLFLMGRLMQRQGNTEAAAEWMERAVKQRPDYADAVKQMAQLYDNMGQPEKAAAVYERALEPLPVDANLRHLLGRLYVRQDRLDEAKDILQQAYELNPRSLSLLEDMILVYGQLGNDAAVRFYTNKALDIDSNFVVRKLGPGR